MSRWSDRQLAARIAAGDRELYEAWWRDHRQAFLRGQIEQARQELAALPAQIDELEKQKAQKVASIGNVWPVAPDTVNDLRSRRMLLEVDLAGANSKIEATRKILRERQSVTPQMQEQLETIRTAAQVDMEAIAAQQQRVEGILQTIEELHVIDRKLETRRGPRQPAAEALIDLFGKALESPPARPFTLSKDVVEIHPIKWDILTTAPTTSPSD